MGNWQSSAENNSLALSFSVREPKATEVGQETIKRLTLILFLHRYTGTRSDVDVGGRRGGNESRNDDSLPTPTE